MFRKFGQDLPQSLVDAVSGIMEAGLPEPAKPDPEAIARRKRLQALKDKAEDEKAEKGEDKPKSNVKVHKGTYGTEYKGDMEEELKGNQHKIDANKNGKIDAHDFKLLRGKKKANEEVESIEERELTPGETEKKEKYVKSMKKGLAGFKKRYGERGKSVMYATATKMAKEEVEADELVLDLREGKDLPFDPDKSPKKSAVAGKHGYGPSAARHLARQGLSKILNKKKTNETMMGKAGCTSEETEIEESRGHKIIATKLAQIDKMSTGIAPDHNTNNQSTKDKIKDVANVKKAEIVTQKDTSMHDAAKENEADELETKHKLNKMSHGYGNVQHNEEVELDETATLDKYIKSMGYDPLHMDKNKKVMFSKTNAFKSWAQRQEDLYDGGQKGTQDIDTHMSPGATARGK